MSVRDECAEWAREVLADSATVVLDTETTGLRGYACEISVFNGTTFPINTLVNPQVPVEPGAQQVHQIPPDELAAAPLFSQVWPALQNILAHSRVIVYNADFDSAVIRRELQRLGVPVPALTWECAMRKYSDWCWGQNDARFVRLNGGHRAGDDCKAVFDRLREMAS